MGTSMLVDAVQMYVESVNWPANTATSASAAYHNVVATATQTINGVDVTNTWHKGTEITVNFTTINATCTVGLNLLAKDPASGLYTSIARLSLDGITTGNTNAPFFWAVYPSIAATNGVNQGQGNSFYTSGLTPRTMRVQASITATASNAGSALVSYTLAVTKIL